MQLQNTFPEEEWRAVVGYEGWYSVSSFGRVRREMPARRTYRGRILPGWANKDGYLQVLLYVRGKRKTWLIHQLVAFAYLGERPSGMEVNHKNGVKLDNRADNFEWLTHPGNLGHAHRSGLQPIRRGDAAGHRKLTCIQVEEIHARLASGEFQKKIAADYGVGTTTIGAIATGQNWGHQRPPRPPQLMPPRPPTT